MTEDRKLVDQVGAEQPQRAVRGMLVVEGHLEHEGVDRDGAGVVGDDERPRLARHVLKAHGLHPKPVPVERADQLKEHLVVQLRVEAELVDLVLPGEPATQEGQELREAVLDGVGPAVAGAPPRGRDGDDLSVSGLLIAQVVR